MQNNVEMTKKINISEDDYVTITNLQCCRNAISCLQFVSDERIKGVIKTLHIITSEIERRQ